MGEIKELFQRLFSRFDALLTEAQAAGQIEKYVLEVVVRGQEVGGFQHTALYTALVNLLHTLQEVLENYYPTKKKPDQVSSVVCPVASRLCDDSSDHLSRAAETVGQEEKVSCKPSVTHHQHLPRLSPPLQPTTKETEAANVLMNLSGKAADRGAQVRLEPCPPLHPHHLPKGPASKTPIYSCLSSGSGRKDLGSRREQPLCDEVPQINEKDLLPLATQVLCQFCSRQCEDLVELHEHVLGVHHTAETDTPFTVPHRKSRTPSRPVEEGDVGGLVEGRGQQQDQVASSTAMFVLLQQPGSSHTEGEKKGKRKGKLKRDNSEIDKVNVYDSTREGSSQKKENCLEDWQPPPTGGGPDIPHTAPSHLQPNQPSPTLPTNSMCDKDRDWLKGQGGRSVTELTPVGGVDALAIAVESSQIRVLEAKVTILVCLNCSSGFTDPQEYSSHMCLVDRPLVHRGSDGSVTLVDAPLGSPDPQLQLSDVLFFPEFLIQQSVDGSERSLQVVHTTSGRRLSLHTNCQPAYLREQLISFRCPTCEKDCDSLTRFLEHLTAGPCMFRCPDCQLVYITLDKLQKHRASLHPSIEDRTCPNCHHVFEKRHQRNKHLKTKCSQRHVCVVCGGLLKNEYNLRVHMEAHQEEKKHVCKECGAAFHRQAVLTRHKMRHAGNKPHACPQCSSRFYTRQHLHAHLDRHNGHRRFPCSTCNKAYYSKHDRDNHHFKVHCKIPQKSLPNTEQKMGAEHVTE